MTLFLWVYMEDGRRENERMSLYQIESQLDSGIMVAGCREWFLIQFRHFVVRGDN